MRAAITLSTMALLMMASLSGCSVLFGVDDFTVGGGADGGDLDAGSDPGTDASADAGTDGGADGGTDAGTVDDAGLDGGSDAGEDDAGTGDAGPPPECVVNADCDDGNHCTADRCSLEGTCSSTPDPSCIGGITGGLNFTCAMRNGRVYCWGQGTSGQLGTGAPLGDTSAASIIPELTGVRAIATGNIHACAIVDAGKVKCWGSNSSGQVGEGAAHPQPTPYDVPWLTDAVQLGLGYRHTCALRVDGTVWCWGRNGSRQLGDHALSESGTPLQVPGIAGAVQLGVGNDHACVLLAGGSVRCWGTRTSGRLGDGGDTTGSSGVPVAVSGITDAVALAVSGIHSCVLRAGGTMACWGGGTTGALGDDSFSDTATPTTVLDPTGTGPLTGVAQMALGNGHSCVLTTGGGVLCWGSNSYGELTGAGNRSRPTPVPAVTGAVYLGLGEDHSCALIGLGRDAVCWGRNRNGQLGDGTTDDSAVPRQVMGL